jgi:hypothetical protein
MKLTYALGVAITVLAIGAPVAGATPDGYQPQLKSGSQPDAFLRYLRNNEPQSGAQPDAFMRYLHNNQPQTGAATHPDSRPVRVTADVQATPTDEVGSDARDVTTGVIGAVFGAFVALLAIASASAIRGRRRLVLR